MIDTERLHLRPYIKGDLPALHALYQDEGVRRFLGSEPPTLAASHERLLRTAGGWALDGYGLFAVIERASGDYVGHCGLFHPLRELGPDFDPDPEAGWIIAQSRWGRGYAHEAMKAALAWFDSTQGAQRTVCMIAKGNAPSERLAARLGYREMRSAMHHGDEVVLYERKL